MKFTIKFLILFIFNLLYCINKLTQTIDLNENIINLTKTPSNLISFQCMYDEKTKYDEQIVNQTFIVTFKSIINVYRLSVKINLYDYMKQKIIYDSSGDIPNLITNISSNQLFCSLENKYIINCIAIKQLINQFSLSYQVNLPCYEYCPCLSNTVNNMNNNDNNSITFSRNFTTLFNVNQDKKCILTKLYNDVLACKKKIIPPIPPPPFFQCDNCFINKRLLATNIKRNERLSYQSTNNGISTHKSVCQTYYHTPNDKLVLVGSHTKQYPAHWTVTDTIYNQNDKGEIYLTLPYDSNNTHYYSVQCCTSSPFDQDVLNVNIDNHRAQQVCTQCPFMMTNVTSKDSIVGQNLDCVGLCQFLLNYTLSNNIDCSLAFDSLCSSTMNYSTCSICENMDNILATNSCQSIENRIKNNNQTFMVVKKMLNNNGESKHKIITTEITSSNSNSNNNNNLTIKYHPVFSFGKSWTMTENSCTINGTYYFGNVCHSNNLSVSDSSQLAATKIINVERKSNHSDLYVIYQKVIGKTVLEYGIEYSLDCKTIGVYSLDEKPITNLYFSIDQQLYTLEVIQNQYYCQTISIESDTSSFAYSAVQCQNKTFTELSILNFTISAFNQSSVFLIDKNNNPISDKYVCLNLQNKVGMVSVEQNRFVSNVNNDRITLPATISIQSSVNVKSFKRDFTIKSTSPPPPILPPPINNCNNNTFKTTNTVFISISNVQLLPLINSVSLNFQCFVYVDNIYVMKFSNANIDYCINSDDNNMNYQCKIGSILSNISMTCCTNDYSNEYPTIQIYAVGDNYDGSLIQLILPDALSCSNCASQISTIQSGGNVAYLSVVNNNNPKSGSVIWCAINNGGNILMRFIIGLENAYQNIQCGACLNSCNVFSGCNNIQLGDSLEISLQCCSSNNSVKLPKVQVYVNTDNNDQSILTSTFNCSTKNNVMYGKQK